MSIQGIQNYVSDSLLILADSVRHYRQGQRPFYRVAALQLRLLLCDTTRVHNRRVDLALLPRLAPDLRLPRLSGSGQPDAGVLMELPGWLEQTLPAGVQTLSVRQLIRQVCDQDGGAHVDTRPQNTLPDGSEYIPWIIALAECVLEYASSLPGLRPEANAGDAPCNNRWSDTP